MGASGPVCRSALKWHVRMFAWALHRLCGMARPSVLPAHCLLHGPAELPWCLWVGLGLTFRAGIPVSSIQQLFRAFTELNIPAVWQGGRIVSLRKLKITARKTCSVISWMLRGGVRGRIKWSVASYMYLPLSTAFGHGDWLYQILNVWPSKQFLQEKK